MNRYKTRKYHYIRIQKRKLPKQYRDTCKKKYRSLNDGIQAA